MKKALFIILAVICFVSPFFSWIPSIVKCVRFSSQCGDYLELSANANSIEIAEKRLTKAIDYLEENNITSGCTKVFVYYPKNDIGEWYTNLKIAQTQLREMLERENITELEESNMLMKLRETILNENGSLTKPFCIALYPNYKALFWCNWLLWMLWFLGIVFCFVAYDED